ncbi:MAG: ATP-binding cassette domain-containing protein [Mycoplasmataceae bacterium]|nr:ATP-binding cassette domain-containing protein [Mycoplasmataceae bacterium]
MKILNIKKNTIENLITELNINTKAVNDLRGAEIKFNNVGKKYQGRVEYTLEDINFVIKSKELCVILGPSGCGKTTLLRMIAGLNSITKGDLLFDGKRVNDLEPADRDIAMVFQSYALYPHMNVYKNIAFGLQQQKVRKDVIERRIKDVAEILQITDRLYDKPKDLSGGQRQRVAIARAIVRKPSVFLMDEPLSNLDAKLRESTRREIVNIHKFIGSTSVYVTHDQLEAMTMANKIILMNDSKIQQIGTPIELYMNPKNLFVANFIGSPSMNMINGIIENKKFKSLSGNLVLDISSLDIQMENNKSVCIGVRPEDIIHVTKKTESDFELFIESTEFIGKEKIISGTGDISKSMILITVPNWLDIYEDSHEYFQIRKESIHIFDNETGLSLKQIEDIKQK